MKKIFCALLRREWNLERVKEMKRKREKTDGKKEKLSTVNLAPALMPF
jgi:hypothetical protein